MRIIIYLISVHFFFRNPFYSLSLFHSFIHQYHLPDVHDARDLESIFSSLIYEKDPYFHHKREDTKDKRKWYQVLKKKIKNAFTIVYSTSFIHRGIGLERLANKIKLTKNTKIKMLGYSPTSKSLSFNMQLYPALFLFFNTRFLQFICKYWSNSHTHTHEYSSWNI